MSITEESESEGSESSSSSSEEEKSKIPIVKQRRAAKNVNYNTNEYDEMIKSALEQEEHYAEQGTYEEGGKNIISRETYRNFILSLEWKISEGGHN